MSRENVETVRRVFEAAARRDRAGVFAHYADDIVWDASRTQRGALAGRVTRGHDALLGWLREWYGAWDHVDDELLELIDAGEDKVVAIMVQRARGATSGIEVADELGTIWEFRQALIARVTWFPSGAAARAAAGV